MRKLGIGEIKDFNFSIQVLLGGFYLNVKSRKMYHKYQKIHTINTKNEKKH